VQEQQLLDLAIFRTSDAFTPLEKLVLELAVAMSATPADVPQELFASLRKHFDEAQLVELTATIAWEHYRSRFNRTFAIASQGFSEGAYCALPERHPVLELEGSRRDSTTSSPPTP
jgi:alkylhydroperoxidase family enzyme